MPEVAFELLLARGLDSEPSLDRGGAGVGLSSTLPSALCSTTM